jgi:putative PIN family toxin of toxin-antitoxin system
MMRLVLDTDVLYAGIRSAEGASRQLLLAILDRHAELLLSTSLLVEYEAVLTRAAFLDETGLQADAVLAILDDLAGLCVPVAFDYRWRPAARDPNDDLVLETAINGGADAIATFNLADLADGAARFGILAARPSALLKRLSS